MVAVVLHLDVLYHYDFRSRRLVNGDGVHRSAAARRRGGGRARRGMVISRIGAREIEAGELARVGYRTLGATSRESPYDI